MIIWQLFELFDDYFWLVELPNRGIFRDYSPIREFDDYLKLFVIIEIIWSQIIIE